MVQLWQQIKRAIFTEKKQYLEPAQASGAFDRYFLNVFRRNALRVAPDNAADAYRFHELVYSCVNKTADVMNDAEITVERLSASGEYERVPGHPLTALFNYPNSIDTCEDLRRKMVISELCTGIVYIAVNRSKAGLPAELVVLNPGRVQPRYDRSRQEISHYEYTKSNGQVERIETEDMWVRRRADLSNQFGGLAPVEVALKSVNSDIGLSQYTDAFFESDATPSGILKILNRTASETEKQKLQEAWRLRYGRGGANQKGLAVLDQNAEYQKIGSTLSELDSEPVSFRFESRICSVFGVPPILVGAYVGLRWVNQRASAKEALTDFWINKISPDLKALRKWLTYFVLPEFESLDDIKAERVRVSWDISQAGFLQDEVDDIYNRSIKAFEAKVLTRNEAREMMGLAPVEGGDDFLETAPEPAELPAAAEDEPEVAAEELAKNKGEIVKTKPLKKKIKQSKSIEYDGLTLSREPTELELKIDFKAKAEDVERESEKIIKNILALRKELILDAAKQAARAGFENLEQIEPEVPQNLAKRLERLLREAFDVGRREVLTEIELQKADDEKTGNFQFELKEREFEVLAFLNVLLAKIVSEIKSRAVNAAALLYSLEQFSGENIEQELEEELREKLLEESLKAFEQTGRNAANFSVQSGREAELLANDEINLFEYSAILDARTCPNCRKWDGKRRDKLSKLPRCPNPKCDGSWNCRCFIIGIRD